MSQFGEKKKPGGGAEYARAREIKVRAEKRGQDGVGVKFKMGHAEVGKKIDCCSGRVGDGRRFFGRGSASKNGCGQG